MAQSFVAVIAVKDESGDIKYSNLKVLPEVQRGTVSKTSNTGKSMAQRCDSADYSDGAGDTQYLNLKDFSGDRLFRLLAERLGAHWEPIATFLGISSDNITALKKEYSDPDEQIFQMLTAWQKNLADTGNMVQLLVNALEQGGRKDLAKELQNGLWKIPKEPVVPTTSSGKPHGTPTIEEKRLRKFSEKLSGDMERLATELGVASERVDKIKDKNRKVAEQTFQMFRYWQCNTPGVNHLDELVTALKAVGRRDVAREIENGTL
ncbi:uncharacterized protein LOC119730846 isoform X2 [Patiria miniata]|uniref:Death domain-containing protein n=1 Tax=Patiria miniata TaxID=46514 RepID=A0A914A8S5_PATMI|nr:uncharacterized protein LOC119730846 isoform X2 [Patiria miniata]